MGTSNDIVINARATTAQAEKDIGRLDGKIKTLSKTGGDNAKAYAASFAAMQGSVNGVITKLGGLGVAIGAVIALQKAQAQAQADYAKSVSNAGKAEEQALNARAARTKEILNSLEQLNAKAKDSPLSPEAIKLENNLVAQLADTWGDVGISINQSTGEIKGLLQATQQINAQIRQQKLDALAKQIEGARLELDNAQTTYNNEYDQYGSQRVSIAGIGNNLRAAGEGLLNAATNNPLQMLLSPASGLFSKEFETAYNQRVDTRANEYKAAITEAQAKLDNLLAQQKALKLEATNEDAARILKQTEETRAAQQSINANDPQEQALIRALANAQMTGGDVTGAKGALDAYLQQRNTERYNALSGMVSKDESDISNAQKNYDKAMAGGDAAEIAETAKALARAVEVAKKHTDEMAKIAAGQYKPASAPETAITRSLARGTFDAFGLGGLSGGNIQQQQLDVQKQIERNTQQLAVPVVGE